jgi:hypothetical protein
MNGSELTDTALSAFQSMAGGVLPNTLLPSAFCAVAVSFWNRYLFPALFQTSQPDRVDIQLIEFIGTFALAFLVALPLFLFGLSLMMPIATRSTASWMLGEDVGDQLGTKKYDKNSASDVGRAFRLISASLLRVMSGVLISVILFIVSGGISQFIPQAKWLAAPTLVLAILGSVVAFFVLIIGLGKYALAVPVMFVEQANVRDALNRSLTLMGREGTPRSGYASLFSQCVMILVIYILLEVGFSLLIGLGFEFLGSEEALKRIPFGPVLFEACYTLPSFLALWFTVPLLATSLTVTYFERRARLEGYDIAHLAQEISSHRRGRFDLPR